jgi:hypothetical protein
MTRLPKSKQWVLSRDTRLESGEHHIDALDIEGVPIRICAKKHIPGTHPFTADDANAEGDNR